MSYEDGLAVINLEMPSRVPRTEHSASGHWDLIKAVTGIEDMFLMAIGTDPQRFGQVANRYAACYQQFFDALAQSDVEIVMVHDDITWTRGVFVSPV